MKIYISHSTDFDFKKELYEPLKMANLDCEFILPHEEGLEQYPVKELFSSKECGLVIAEVSFPSTGQGIELGWANLSNVPIVCVYKENSKYSGALTVVSEKFITYQNEQDLIEAVKKII